MLGWLWRFFIGRFKPIPVVPPCQHHWKIISSGKVSDTHDRQLGEIYVVQCEKCGELEDRDFRVEWPDEDEYL